MRRFKWRKLYGESFMREIREKLFDENRDDPGEKKLDEVQR